MQVITTLYFEDRVALFFEDTGPGITTNGIKSLQEIFEPFFSTKEISHSAGMGYGLAYTEKVITAHHGKIHVENCEDEGARFIISLPIISK